MPLPECTFYLNNIYIYASCQCVDGRASAGIGKATNKTAWANGDLPKDVSARMRRIKHVVDQYVSQCDLAVKQLYKLDVEKLIAGELVHKKIKKSTKSGMGFYDAVGKYIPLLVSGEVNNKGKKYSQSVIDLYSAIHTGVIDKSAIRGKDIGKITSNDLEAIKKHLVDTDKSQNTISIYITQIRTFFNKTQKLGWHNNDVGKDKDVRVPLENIDTKVYVNARLLDAMLLADIPDSKLQRVRDSFVYGCNIGQRLSDCRRFRPESRQRNQLVLGTKKGGNKVVIPMNSTAIAIWNKYSGSIPFETEYYYKRCQDLCKYLSDIPGFEELKQPALYTYTHGGVRDSAYYPFYELIGSHTMRRSFATNGFIAGVPIRSLMPITGHKTIESFMKYICIDVEENATLMQQHPFFK